MLCCVLCCVVLYFIALKKKSSLFLGFLVFCCVGKTENWNLILRLEAITEKAKNEFVLPEGLNNILLSVLLREE